jgi:hypothetical protein
VWNLPQICVKLFDTNILHKLVWNLSQICVKFFTNLCVIYYKFVWNWLTQTFYTNMCEIGWHKHFSQICVKLVENMSFQSVYTNFWLILHKLTVCLLCVFNEYYKICVTLTLKLLVGLKIFSSNNLKIFFRCRAIPREILKPELWASTRLKDEITRLQNLLATTIWTESWNPI